MEPHLETAPLRLFQPKSRPLPPVWCGLSLPLATASPPAAARNARRATTPPGPRSPCAGSGPAPSFLAEPHDGPDTARSGRWAGPEAGPLSRDPAKRHREAGCRVEVVGVTCQPPVPSPVVPLPARSSHVLRPRPPCRRRSPPQLQHLGPGRPDDGSPGQPRPQGRRVPTRACGAVGRPGYREGSAERKSGRGRGEAPQPRLVPPDPPESPPWVCTASGLGSFGAVAPKRIHDCLQLPVVLEATNLVLVASVQIACPR